MTKLQQSARKAVKTRRARQNFIRKYGVETAEVVALLIRNKSNSYIEENLFLPAATVRAYKANFTRGVYTHSMKNCNFSTY